MYKPRGSKGMLPWQIYVNRQHRPRFVYTNFKSCDQSLDKTSSDFSDIVCAMQSHAMSPKSSTILKLRTSMVT